MPITHSFKQGDLVPEWVERSENVILHFAVDVDVSRETDGVSVYPKTEGYKYIMRGEAIDKSKPGIAHGAPTAIYRFPYGDPRNATI